MSVEPDLQSGGPAYCPTPPYGVLCILLLRGPPEDRTPHSFRVKDARLPRARTIVGRAPAACNRFGFRQRTTGFADPTLGACYRAPTRT